MSSYNPQNWYWTVGDTNPGTQVFQSTRGFIGVGDATFHTWLSTVNTSEQVGGGFLGSANNGAGLIRVNCGTTQNFTTGMFVYYVGNNSGAFGPAAVTVIDGTHFDLQGSTFSAADTSAQIYGATFIDTEVNLALVLGAAGLALIPTSSGFYSSKSLTIAVDTILTNPLSEFTFITNNDGTNQHNVTLPPANQPNSAPIGFPFYIFNLAASTAGIFIRRNDGVLIGSTALYPGDKIMLCCLSNSTAAGTFSFARLPAFISSGFAGGIDALIPVGQTSAATPAFATWLAPSGDLTMSDLGAFTFASIITAGGPTGDASHVAQITYDAKGRLTAVTSVAIAISDSAITYGNKSAHTVFAGPSSGAAAPPGFRALVAADIPQLPFTDLTGTIASGQVSGSYTGITGVGILTAGTWNGTKIVLAYGGTNADLSATGGTSQVLKQTTVGGNVSVGQLAFTDISGSATAAQVPALQGYIAGLTLSNDSGTPNSVLDIAAGVAADTTAAVMIKLGAFTKSTAGSWTSGTGNNGMGNGLTIANTTWYHVILANNGGTPDIYFDTSATGANRPAGISDTKVRRIGSFLTDGSAHIIAFVQDGDVFRWDLPLADVNGAANPGTAAVTRTLTVPTGVQVYADMVVAGQNTGNTATPIAVYISDLALTDRAAGNPVTSIYVLSIPAETLGILSNNFLLGAPVQCRTNTSAQVRSRLQASDANTFLYITTLGWSDRRGAR